MQQQTADLAQLENLVTHWAAERGIYAHSTVQAQVLKAVSEMGELADATIKGQRDEFRDAVGDVMVCLANAAHMSGMDLTECLAAAWDDIKDRKGRMVPGGAFVKEPA